jgi:hypothetical protein
MAGFGGGFDREWLEPLTDEGNVNDEHPEYGKAVGAHKGQHEYLNIYRPKPGYTYVWERKKPNDLRRALQKGGEIVKSDDQEMTAAASATGVDLIGQLDSMVEYNELQLVRYPEAAIRKIREAEQARAQAMMRGADQDYVDSTTHAERNPQYNPRGIKTRFATNQHRTEFAGDGEVQDQWTPDQGIID